MELTDAIQDYIKEIYKLESSGRRVATSALAQQLDVSAPSVTSMLKKLASLGLVEHERYRGARLTAHGERVALEVIRHHRLTSSATRDRKSTRLNSSHANISYAVFC